MVTRRLQLETSNHLFADAQLRTLTIPPTGDVPGVLEQVVRRQDHRYRGYSAAAVL